MKATNLREEAPRTLFLLLLKTWPTKEDCAFVIGFKRGSHKRPAKMTAQIGDLLISALRMAAASLLVEEQLQKHVHEEMAKESIPYGIKPHSKVDCSLAVGGILPYALCLWRLPYFNCKAEERKIKVLIPLVRSPGPRVPN
ncbi:hypothetical protein OIU85_016055 [Salix viminalis]|uniref:Uncharacterized protein n=1 Tax=Salix viminalis TaxID=40686 RepID=A0A9Q0ZPE5_SALVM|nr:hypothetical protein OIU85_016055 [Salix viminalis]